MVKICPNEYPSQNELIYSEHFEKYPFPLSSFQKFSIQAITEGNHILVTAHTGSGKTLPAEFAIQHFTSMKKKVIYTSPIKALSNQKFYEFSKKFPNISFGILTGDIKTNPEADVLIMTTEILMNTLYAKHRQTVNVNSFEMNFDTELACVIFDEIHYINDIDRGHVWEETIMLLPRHIQMVMLSATLDSPEKFAKWCETRGQPYVEGDKIVYLASTYERIVPLTHYSFITCTQGLFKVLKDKALEKAIMKITNKLHVIQDSKGNFNDNNYNTIQRTLNIFKSKRHYVKRAHVLNSVAKHMVQNDMLPAICFVLNRKALEQCAKDVTTVLLEDDSKVPYIVRRECEQIIRKLPNYNEYLHLPEYLEMVALLEKGIAIHHAGIMPVLREMVEILFGKGYVKLLFATETFAVGINMPTKTVLFTDITKFASCQRPFFSHEYTQMAGRAGRRGIDTIGHVIHLTNLFTESCLLTVKTIMKGEPQTLVSKFRINYNLMLNLIDIGESDYAKYMSQSMGQSDIDDIVELYETELIKLKETVNDTLETIKLKGVDIEDALKYHQLVNDRNMAVNKKRRDIDKEILQLTNKYVNISEVCLLTDVYKRNLREIVNWTKFKDDTYNKFNTMIQNILSLLEKNNFIQRDGDSQIITLTELGKTASLIREIHCLTASTFFHNYKDIVDRLSSAELAGMFSCFTSVSVPDEKRCNFPKSMYVSVTESISIINTIYDYYDSIESNDDFNAEAECTMQYDLIDYIVRWCDADTEEDCKLIIQELGEEKDVFLGEFVKAILKINNICIELEKVAEITNNLALLSKLKSIPQLTLKYIATNQSLYV